MKHASLPLLRRREFITLLGGAAAAWPLAARAQQPAMPVIGFLDSRLPDALADRLRGFRLGLKLAGYVEGENVAVVYRFAENQAERLPALAVELVRLPVAVIVASGGPQCGVCVQGGNDDDPYRVPPWRRPGQEWTCGEPRPAERQPNRYQFCQSRVGGEAARALARTGACGHSLRRARQSGQRSGHRDDIARRRTAAVAMGLQIHIVRASTSREIDAAFAAIVSERSSALFVAADPFFSSRRVQLSLAAMRHAVPAIYSGREYAEAGGLMSYGSDITDAYRQIGAYTGRILKGAKPADRRAG